MMIANTNTEHELVQRAKSGEKKAQTEIVLRHEQMVYNVALRLLGNPDDAECVLQETFLKIFSSISSFRGESSLATWIYRIATNYALMRLRARKNRLISLDDEHNIEPGIIESFNYSIGDNPLKAVMNSEFKSAMDKAINDLPPKYKSTFILKDVEGFSLKEVSEMLNMKLPAVKTNLRRARLFLRDYLAEYAYGVHSDA